MIALRSDDPEDLTVREARWLGEADVVCTRGAVSPVILARARADASRVTCPREGCPITDVPACARPDQFTVILHREA
jgi:uroporphyrin-III C-methyltransferase/precorrin-2 dehydrogenase/sirohydrochlorin ferrochelatase